MNKFILRLTIITLLITAPFMANAAELKFKIKDIRSAKGKILIQLFQGAENYKKGKAISSQMAKAKKGDIIINFHNLKEGEYAIRFFHDENNDGKMESNMVGMPVEGYGFSNNAQPNFGPASYKDMKFTVGKNDATNSSIVIY